MQVYVVLRDYGPEGKAIRRIFQNEADARLFVEGGEAADGGFMTIEPWDVWQRKLDFEQLVAGAPKGGE